MASRKPSPDNPPAGEQGIYPNWSKRDRVWKFDVVAQVDGKQRWSRGHATAPLARATRDQMRVDMRRGLLGSAPARMTVGELVTKHWLPAKQAELLNRSSLTGCRWAAKHIEASPLANLRLTRVTALDVEAWKRDLTSAGYKPNTAKQIFTRFKEIMKWAQERDLIYRIPGARVKAPRGEQHEPPPMDIATIARLLAAADATPEGLIVWTAVMTGLREAVELFSLTWPQLDFHEATVSVKAKTPAGKRTIALGPETLARLQQHRLAQMAAFRDQGRPPPLNVFLDDQGRVWTIPRFWWKWNAIRTAAGLPTLHFHDLRHVQASLLGRAGVPIKVAQERLGHASATTTLDVYQHVMSGAEVEAAEAVEALLKRGGFANA